jgi:hypothetical protein
VPRKRRRHSGKQVVRQVDCEGRRLSGACAIRIYTNLLKWHAASTSSLSPRFTVLFCHDLPCTLCPSSHSCRHPLSLFSFWLLIKMMVKCLSESLPEDSTLPLPFLLGLFFAVNYSLELITFFCFFVIVLVLMFFLSFNPRLSYSCHLRDCLLLLTFSIPLT